MSHYYDEELEAAAELLRKKHKFIEEPEDLVHTPENNVVDMLALDLEKAMVEDEALEERKQTAGKAEGARYCFIGDICLAMNSNDLQALATGLKDLVALIDEEEFKYAPHLVSQMLLLMTEIDKQFMTNLVGARMAGLKKYSVNNYREQIPVELLLDSVARHLIQVIAGNNIDDESGVHHFGHISANLIIIETQLRLYYAT